MQFKLSKDSKVTTTIPSSVSQIYKELMVHYQQSSINFTLLRCIHSEMHTRTVSQTNIIISIVPLLVVPKTSWEIKSAIFLRFLWVKFKDA